MWSKSNPFPYNNTLKNVIYYMSPALLLSFFSIPSDSKSVVKLMMSFTLNRNSCQNVNLPCKMTQF